MPSADAAPRARRLSRDRVVATAAAIADADGLGAVTMRSLATALEVKPMSLYNHVGGKEDLLDGMADLVFGQITAPDARGHWRDGIRARAVSARAVLSRHPWALTLMESRSNPGPATLRHHDAVVGVLLDGGFSPPAAARAYTVVDAYVYGFVLQEVSLPLDDFEARGAAEAMGAGGEGDRYPHLAALAAGHLARPGYSFGAEFEPGLDLVLDAVAALVGS